MNENYTIISGTNRAGSNTRKVAEYYEQLLKQKQVPARLLSLEGWSYLEKNPAFEQLEKEILVPTHKFIFISPYFLTILIFLFKQ